MSEYLEEVVEGLRQVPGYRDVRAGECRITRLGGLTNLVHRVEVRGQSLIVRIPGAGTGEYIDRAVEATNARAAHQAGVSARVLHADGETGLMVSEAIADIVTMTPALFAAREGAARRAGVALAKLHGSGVAFDFRFELFSMIAEYLKILSGKDVALPEGYHDVVSAAAPIRDLLDAHPADLAPCHCDPLCENFLDDGEVMWIVDWEYSGMNDPVWDVGDLAVEAEMTPALEAELMAGYFGGPPTAAQVGRMVIYKAMCDLLWTLWGLIQLADGNEAEDFWAYATGRFARCKALMADPGWDGHLAAVAAG